MILSTVRVPNVPNAMYTRLYDASPPVLRPLYGHGKLINRYYCGQNRSLSPGPGTRNYENAIATLNSLQSNFSIIDAIRKSGQTYQRAIPEMIEWCKRIGYQPSDLNRLNPIHIAGTKGKGSTSAFTASILSQYLPSVNWVSSRNHSPIRKVGSYTSPHLRFVRERIQIDNVPLSEEEFAKYFWETWDRIEASGPVGIDPSHPQYKPAYFRFLTLMAFHTYMSEGVNAAIIECGLGGEYDSTNIIVQPAVCAITSLGIDHTAILGSTIEEIAWHKGGIIKTGAKAFTVPQPDRAMEVLYKRAEEKGVELRVAEGHPELTNGGPIGLGLSGDFQYSNATLAVAIAGEFLKTIGVEGLPKNILKEPLPKKFRKGLEDTRLSGRCEIRSDRNIRWCIDGAHTLESIRGAGQWFASQVATDSSSRGAEPRKPNVLIFNQQTRDSTELARELYRTLSASLGSKKLFTHAIFCTNITYKGSGYKSDLVSINVNTSDVGNLCVQKTLAQTWKAADPSAEVKVFGTIEEAVEFVRDLAGKENLTTHAQEVITTLVTGSLHLVGGLIDVIETNSRLEC